MLIKCQHQIRQTDISEMSSLIDIYVNTVVVYTRLFTLFQTYVYFHAMKIVTETDTFYSTFTVLLHYSKTPLLRPFEHNDFLNAKGRWTLKRVSIILVIKSTCHQNFWPQKESRMIVREKFGCIPKSSYVTI